MKKLINRKINKVQSHKLHETVGVDACDYDLVAKKSVLDSDGFWTDYCWYYDYTNDRHVFVFGDSDIYSPYDGDFDWECETEEEAEEWFRDYNGFAEDFTYDDDGAFDLNQIEKVVNSKTEDFSLDNGVITCDTELEKNAVVQLLDKYYNDVNVVEKNYTDAQYYLVYFEDLKEDINESVELKEDRYDQCKNDADSICRFLDAKKFYNYSLVDYDMYPMGTSKVSFEIEGDWKHDHWYFKDLVYDWAEENNRDIFKIDSQEIGESDSDYYTAQYDVFITKDRDSLDTLNSMRGLFAESKRGFEEELKRQVKKFDVLEDAYEFLHSLPQEAEGMMDAFDTEEADGSVKQWWEVYYWGEELNESLKESTDNDLDKDLIEQYINSHLPKGMRGVYYYEAGRVEDMDLLTTEEDGSKVYGVQIEYDIVSFVDDEDTSALETEMFKVTGNDVEPVYDKHYFDMWVDINESLTELENDKESMNEDRSLAKPFKKELKNAYKAFDARRDLVRKKNDATVKAWDQAADGIPMDDNAKKILLKPEPKFSGFKPDRSNSLEREEYPFYVTYYEETPYYHPEEGGYYVAGRQAIMSKGFDNKDDALKFAKDAADQFGFEKIDDTWYHQGSRYIGEDDSVRVETRREYLSREEGDSVYESLTEELSTEAKRNALDRINTEGGYAAYDLEDAAMKYQPDAKDLNDLTDDTINKVYDELKQDFLKKIKVYGDDADLDGVLYDVFGVSESLNESLGADIDKLEQQISDMEVGDSVIVKNYKNGDTYEFVKRNDSNQISAFKNIRGKNHMASPMQVFGWAKDSLIYAHFNPQFSSSDLTEDTIKTKDGKWTNKGDEGTHGKFDTKKEADAQRRAIWVNWNK